MRFTPLVPEGVWLIQGDRRADDRGYFVRTFCAAEFAAHGLPTVFPQCNTSFNAAAGTLRGLHWQADPFPEGKLVRCTAGAVFDVAVDLRPGSATHRQWVFAELSAANGDALYIPPGFAHGFQALQDGSELFYQMTESYRDGLARGLRWNDPALAIAWPLPDPILSARDAALPLLG
jgi:dTDP-4-dehydrorhamnose 3,5-epimerase